LHPHHWSIQLVVTSANLQSTMTLYCSECHMKCPPASRMHSLLSSHPLWPNHAHMSRDQLVFQKSPRTPMPKGPNRTCNGCHMLLPPPMPSPPSEVRKMHHFITKDMGPCLLAPHSLYYGGSTPHPCSCPCHPAAVATASHVHAHEHQHKNCNCKTQVLLCATVLRSH